MPDILKDLIHAWTQPAVIITLLMSIGYSIVWMVKLDDRVDLQNKQIERVLAIVEEHNKEAEIWKRKILINEQRNRH